MSVIKAHSLTIHRSGMYDRLSRYLLLCEPPPTSAWQPAQFRHGELYVIGSMDNRTRKPYFLDIAEVAVRRLVNPFVPRLAGIDLESWLIDVEILLSFQCRLTPHIRTEPSAPLIESQCMAEVFDSVIDRSVRMRARDYPDRRNSIPKNCLRWDANGRVTHTIPRQTRCERAFCKSCQMLSQRTDGRLSYAKVSLNSLLSS